MFRNDHKSSAATMKRGLLTPMKRVDPQQEIKVPVIQHNELPVEDFMNSVSGRLNDVVEYEKRRPKKERVYKPGERLLLKLAKEYANEPKKKKTAPKKVKLFASDDEDVEEDHR